MGVRHCEAAQPPKQSRGVVPRVTGGRRPVWPCLILDCFARAVARARNDGDVALALAMTVKGIWIASPSALTRARNDREGKHAVCRRVTFCGNRFPLFGIVRKLTAI
jgi:hypothetical protein